MSAFDELEDAVYDALIKQFPTYTFVFAYNNTPEVKTPYTVINIVRLDATGAASQEGLTDLGTQLTLQTYEAKVCLETIGENTSTTVAGSIAQEIDFSLRTPLMREALTLNKLSLMRYKPIERFPRIRDTKTYMVYKQDVFFGYALNNAQDVGYVTTLDLEAVYRDAGRDGNVINSTIHIA